MQINNFRITMKYKYPNIELPDSSNDIFKKACLADNNELMTDILKYSASNTPILRCQQLNIFDCFIFACEHNKLDTIHILLQHIFNSRLYYHFNYFFEHSCKNDLMKITDFIFNWAIQKEKNISFEFIFEKCCTYGLYDLVVKLVESNIKFNLRHNSSLAFRNACENGHLVIAQYIYQICPKIQYNKLNNYAFRYACENGHLEVAQWLKSTWPNINHRDSNDYAFAYACRNGHIDVVEWLLKSYPEIDIYASNNRAFCLTIRYNQLEMAEYLTKIDANIYIHSPRLFENMLSQTYPFIETPVFEFYIGLHNDENIIYIMNWCLRYKRIDLVDFTIDYFNLRELTVDPNYQKIYDERVILVCSAFVKTKSATKTLI